MTHEEALNRMLALSIPTGQVFGDGWCEFEIEVHYTDLIIIARCLNGETATGANPLEEPRFEIRSVEEK